MPRGSRMSLGDELVLRGEASFEVVLLPSWSLLHASYGDPRAHTICQ